MSEYYNVLQELNRYLPHCLNRFIILEYFDFYEYERNQVINELNYKFRSEIYLESLADRVERGGVDYQGSLQFWIHTRILFTQEYCIGQRYLEEYQYICPNPLHPDCQKSNKNGTRTNVISRC